MILGRLLAVLLATALPFSATALDYLEQIPVETFAKMREVERYQLKVAEKYYTQGNYKVAAVEYEKFITLYERSLAAPYAQLMWSHCLVKQRKVYTAIRDGYRSVIDYWPDSHEAVLSAYLIARSYKGVGEIKNAEKAYRVTAIRHPQHLISVMAKWDLADIYREMQDQNRRVEIWKDLTYKVKRTKENGSYPAQASRHLASHHYYIGDFAEGTKALETTYKGGSLVNQVYNHVRSPVSSLTGDTEKKALGDKLADQAITYVLKSVPTSLADDKAKASARDRYYKVASLHSYARRDKEGLETYDKLSKLIGMDDEIRGHIAGWHRGRKRYGEARKVYGQYTDKVAGLVNIASTWRDEKKPDNAVNIYNQLIGLEKEREGEWLQLTVDTWREVKKWDNAIAPYQSLLKVVPERFSDWYWGIATCHEYSGRLPQAIQSYRQSARYPSAYFSMASCHRRLKQYKEALILYHQARADKGSAPNATIHIGYTYEEYGQKQNAIKWFQQTCKLYPKDGRASQAHAHLQSKYKISVTLGGSNDNK